MITEHLLFAVHEGTVSGRAAAILLNDHCLPIACSHSGYRGNKYGAPVAEFGFHALWESTTNPEEFFGLLHLFNLEAPLEKFPNGLWVYTVEYAYETPDPEDDEDWEHLTGGDLRRPKLAELDPLALGAAPWHGVVL